MQITVMTPRKIGQVMVDIIHHQVPPEPVIKLARVMFDEEINASGESRLADLSYKWHDKVTCVPSIFEDGPDRVDPIGEYRVDITPILPDLERLNSYDNDPDLTATRLRYYKDSQSCFFNGGKYPNHQQLIHSGNVIEVLGTAISNKGTELTKFKTIIPGVTDISGMTHESHPQFVHEWCLTCWTKEKGSWDRNTIYDKGIMYYVNVSQPKTNLGDGFGYAYVQSRFVRML